MAAFTDKILHRMALAWLRRAAPPRGPKPSDGDLQKISRILVIRLDDRIGNAVLVTPLLVALKGRFSRAHVVCLLARRHWELRSLIPSADEFIPFDRRTLARNPLRIRTLIRKLRAMKFDLVFDASDDRTVSFNHLIVTALSGGRVRVGHDRGEAAEFYEVPVPVPDTPRHAADMHLDLLRAVTSFRSTPRPLLKPPKEDSSYGDRFFSENNLKPALPLLIMHPGGRGDKRWPADQFAAVANSLHQQGIAQIALIWGPDDDECARDVMAATGSAVFPAGILSFNDLASLLRRSVLFLSGDCGPMHFASALGTPVLAIFLVSDAGKYKPIGPPDVVLDARQTAVTPESVTDTVVRMIQSSRSRTASQVVQTPQPENAP
ncbi:MAG: glycosyltransferase family 9 protein [candidate division Zixibacteria bacterium]|nr:glycosyltransferase family 9 protein [candidate division Zixibacteria bacterium]